jgi:hypothetical protein
MELSCRNLERPPTLFNLGSKVRKDAFMNLPHDIVDLLCENLPSAGVLALRQASWHVFESTWDSSFWRRMIRRELLPWFWELEVLLKTCLSPERNDAKDLYLWLDKVTTPMLGLGGPFMSIANRRRIWQVCDQIKKLYMERLLQEDEPGDKTDEVAMEIMENSSSLQMPIVFHPQPQGSTTISRQWIFSWDELYQPSQVFESFWNSDGFLVGLGVSFGFVRRMFGQGESDECDIVTHSVPIPADTWIKDIVLYINDIDLLERHIETMSVRALSVSLPV